MKPRKLFVYLFLLAVLGTLLILARPVHSKPLHWKRVAYSCCGSNICLKQRMHTKVVAEQ